MELQQELQRIQDELNEKAAIAEAERLAKEAEILRIEAEKAAIEVEILKNILLIKYFCKI